VTDVPDRDSAPGGRTMGHTATNVGSPSGPARPGSGLDEPDAAAPGRATRRRTPRSYGLDPSTPTPYGEEVGRSLLRSWWCAQFASSTFDHTPATPPLASEIQMHYERFSLKVRRWGGRCPVENLQGGDPVAVLLIELFPGLDGVASTVGGVGGVDGLDDLVGGGVVDDLLVHLAHVDDPLPKLGIGRQRCDGLIEGAAGGGSDLLDGRIFGRACLACGCELCVGVASGAR
jgi:hypothetical protein